MVATLGYTVTGYAVMVSILLSLGATVWGFRRRRSWMLLAAGVLSLFFCVAESLSIGLFILPLPFLQFAVGLAYLLRGPVALRAVAGAFGGLALVFLGSRLIGMLL